LIHDIPLLLVFTSLVVIDFGWLGELLDWAVGGKAQGREKKVPGGKLFLVFFAVLAAASSFLRTSIILLYISILLQRLSTDELDQEDVSLFSRSCLILLMDGGGDSIPRVRSIMQFQWCFVVRI
jgi:hypothetical protein